MTTCQKIQEAKSKTPVWLLAALLMLTLTTISVADPQSPLQSLTLDYPHGEDRIFLDDQGRCLLFYGALPQSQTVREGVFEMEKLFQTLEPLLHPNRPREEWPDPSAQAGMVTLRRVDGSSQDFLIFDQDAFAERLFERARTHLVE